MKTTCKYLYDLSLIMTLLMLCQSCVAYHRTPVSLEQAVQAKTGSKVFTADGSFAKYRYITEIDGKFYGVKKKSGMLVEIPLSYNPDTPVFLKNKSTSKLMTWGLLLYTATATAGIIWLATGNFDIYQ